MKAVIQRVLGAKLFAENEFKAGIGKGLTVYLGISQGDERSAIPPFCKKIAAMRIFSDEGGKMNRSVTDIGGEILLVPNFTLCADTSHGNRPDCTSSMKPASKASEFFYECAAVLSELVPTECGVFGADMRIEQVNDGPVTIVFGGAAK